jgi:glycine/D-amino acid oxidase-like deaminating enzyme
MKVAVIGAGVVGAAVAWCLAEAGASVVILEAHRVGGGTSGVSFAWTNANCKPPKSYHDLNCAGMAAHKAVHEAFGSPGWWHAGGMIEWGDRAGRPTLLDKIRRLEAWDYPVELIGKARLKVLEPDIDLDLIDDHEPIAFFPEDGWLDPVLYANDMVKAAIAHGAELRCGARVTAIATHGSRVKAVRTADGGSVEADVVVNCAGRWADSFPEGAGAKLPLAPTVGFLVFTPPVATSARHVVLSPYVHYRPDGAGRLMMRTNEADQLVSIEMTPTPTMPAAIGVMAGARRLLPCLKEVTPEAARITIRPIPKDGLAAVGPMPRLEGYYLAVTHSGVTLSPFLAQAIADEVVRARPRPELADFRPSRFFN